MKTKRKAKKVMFPRGNVGGKKVNKVAQTFPENVVILFAQIMIYHMLITGNKSYVGYLVEILHLSGVENGHSNEKIAEKASLFFSSLARSAMNGCLVAAFFSLILGSSVRKTSGRLSRDCLEDYRSVFVIN